MHARRRGRSWNSAPDANVKTHWMELMLHVCLGIMADSWGNTTGDYSFRFFSPEQVDQILRDGLRRGREGSHAAIERILKHESGLQRADLWQRIRHLKNPTPRSKYRRSAWSPEDEKILREGYQNGWRGKREAVRGLLRRHPEWRPHAIWKHAAKLRLVQKIDKRGQEHSHLAWSKEDDGILLDLAGYKTARVIARMLHRSEASVRSHLCILGKSSRVHLEGFSRHALAVDLHLSSSTIQRLIIRGLLEVRDPRITRDSLDRLSGSGDLSAMHQNGSATSGISTAALDRDEKVAGASTSMARDTTDGTATSSHHSRAKRVWAEVAKSLGVPLATVEQFIVRGVLKLYDPTITEKSLRNFCRRYGSMINSDALNRETRNWLQSTMDFVPRAGESVAQRLKPLRKHAKVVRRCKCGRTIRGNAFFRHAKRCNQMKAEGL
jgi:hypothetical protein